MGPKRWYLYNKLLFLRPLDVDNWTTPTTKSKSDLVEGLERTETQQASSKPDDIDLSLADKFSSASPLEASQPGPSYTHLSIPTHTSSPLPKRKRPSFPFPQDRPDSLSPFGAEMLSAFKGLQNERKALQDHDEQFLLSLLPVMKSLDPVSKFELRGELNDTALRYLRRARQQSQHQHQNQDEGHPPPRTQSPTPISKQQQTLSFFTTQ